MSHVWSPAVTPEPVWPVVTQQTLLCCCWCWLTWRLDTTILHTPTVTSPECDPSQDRHQSGCSAVSSSCQGPWAPALSAELAWAMLGARSLKPLRISSMDSGLTVKLTGKRRENRPCKNEIYSGGLMCTTLPPTRWWPKCPTPPLMRWRLQWRVPRMLSKHGPGQHLLPDNRSCSGRTH